MQQQDLVWVRLPFSGFEGSKVRPAVVVSNNQYNGQCSDIVVCAVTSNLEARKHSIFITQENLAKGKLPLKSRVRADKIMQIEKQLVLKPFAAVDDLTFDSLIAELIALFKRKK